MRAILGSRRGRTTGATVAAAAVLLLATGCGGDTDPAAGPDPAESRGSDVPGSAWKQIDPCRLVDEQQVSRLLGGEMRSETEDVLGDTDCVWQATDSLHIAFARVGLRAPGEPDPSLETLPVGDATGYVTDQDERSCMLDVEGEPAWLHISLTAIEPEADPAFCAEVVAPLAEDALAEVTDRLGQQS